MMIHGFILELMDRWQFVSPLGPFGTSGPQGRSEAQTFPKSWTRLAATVAQRPAAFLVLLVLENGRVS